MIKAVIFDMDGIIIDSELEYLKMELEFARTKNPQMQLEDLFGMVGSSREDAWSCMARAVHNGQTWQQLRDEFRASVDVYAQMDYRRIFRKEIPGILDRLQEMGLRLALASSTGLPIIHRVLTENNIRHYFEEIVSGAQFKRSKPDPEIYHYTAEKLNLPENQCLAVEDSTFGVTAAYRAGMHIAALYDSRFHFDQSLADFQIKQLEEVVEIARQLQQD